MALIVRQKQNRNLQCMIFAKKKAAVCFVHYIAVWWLDFPAIHWIVQLDCPEEAKTYSGVGRMARCEEDGKALLFLLPWAKEGILEALQIKICIATIQINPKELVVFLYQRSKLGSHRPKPISNVTQRPPLCMHCLSENQLAAHCPHTGDNLLSSLAPQWATSSPAPTSQWTMSLYRSGAQPLNPQRFAQPPAYVANPLRPPRTFTQPMAANYMSVQHIRGAKVQQWPLQICQLLPHMWGTSSRLHVPSVTALKRIEMTLSGPGSISSSKWQKILSRSPVQIWNPPWKIQTKHLPLSVASHI